MMDIRQADGSSDRRWIVLSEDGRAATLGRVRDPSDDEIAQTETEFASRGIAGWLAIQSHSFHAEGPPPSFMEIKPLGVPAVSFETAVAALRATKA